MRQLTKEMIEDHLTSQGIQIWKMNRPVAVVDGGVRTARSVKLTDIENLSQLKDCKNVAIFQLIEIDSTAAILRYDSWN